MTSGSGENQVEYDIEKEVETETKKNQVEHEHDAKTEEEQGEKNNDHEVEDLHVKKTNMKHNYKRSWVWEHFTYDETEKKAKCNHCKTLIICNKGRSSRMASHIKSKHKLIKEKEKKQLTIRETINNSEAIISIMFFSF
ncbi:zinc finger BED domain-containing protein 1-like [Rhizophagus clarus]|uniref:Zinc finger BED domain-containing protein 1-like n=1 Tax=Rhizophagus clarus TaxID=94130 RepID=A0A8H3L6W1_9GLOM|nr:zinc finger BED domain-containing protein 1-like [Rhizophagus clarus]